MKALPKTILSTSFFFLSLCVGLAGTTQTWAQTKKSQSNPPTKTSSPEKPTSSDGDANINSEANTNSAVPAIGTPPPAKKKKLVPVPETPIAPIERERSHRGFVAFFGPVYFMERFNFLVTGGVNKEPAKTTSIGMLAGTIIEYQWEWLTINLDFGVIGAVNTMENDGTPVFRYIETRSMLFGGVARPKLLARLGPVDIGPTFPIVARWVNYSPNVDGAPDTPDFKVHLSTGAHLSYDFGGFRIGADWALLSFKDTFASMNFQFEL